MSGARVFHAPWSARFVLAWAVALALGAACFAVARWQARVLPRPPVLGELMYYPSGRFLEPATLGHAPAAADLAWLRAVQYYGECRRTDNRFFHLYHVFDILTTLAPRFESAYVFGAFALAQEGRDPAQAERLLLKGLDRNPTSGWLAFEAGFFYFVRPEGRDLPRAAEYFERAVRLPGGPARARHFAAYARQNSGDLAVAYELWRQTRDSSANRYLREIADREMQRIRRAIETGRASEAVRRLPTPRVLFRADS